MRMERKKKKQAQKVTQEAIRQYYFNALLTVGNKPNELEVMTSQKPKRQGKEICIFSLFYFLY